MDLFSTREFMPGWHCVSHNLLWGWLTILSAISILIPYWITAYKQYHIIFKLKPGYSRSSLLANTNIFTLCGIASYLFMIVMMWWPVWQIRSLIMVVLSVAAWKNVLQLPNLKSVYGQVQDKAILSDELVSQQETNKLIVKKTEELKPHINKLSDSVIFNVDDQTSIKTLKKIEEIRYEIDGLTKTLKELESIKTKPSSN